MRSWSERTYALDEGLQNWVNFRARLSDDQYFAPLSLISIPNNAFNTLCVAIIADFHARTDVALC
jgi:hypothetical protein